MQGAGEPHNTQMRKMWNTMKTENANYTAKIEITRVIPDIVDKYNNVQQQYSLTEILQIKVSAASLEKLQTIIKAHVDLAEE